MASQPDGLCRPHRADRQLLGDLCLLVQTRMSQRLEAQFQTTAVFCAVSMPQLSLSRFAQRSRQESLW